MKKSAKIALIVAGAMLVVGGALCTLTWTLGIGGRLHLPAKLPLTANCLEETLPIAADGSVRIHVMTDDVTVGVSPDRQAHLSYYDTAFLKNVVTADAGAITLSQEVLPQRAWPDIKRWIAEWNMDTSVTLLLPKGFSGEVVISSTTGSITAETLELKLLSLDCTTGDLDVRQLRADTVALGTSTGSILLADADIVGALTVTTTTGEARLDEVTADAVERRASTGKTVLSGVTAGSVFVNASTGDVVLQRLSADAVTIALTTGSVRGTLLGTAAAYADALHITTTTGDISITYEE